jgi:hypothetical protein
MTRTTVAGPRASLNAHGISVRLPDRWEARLFLRDAAGTTEELESINPVLHLANFALPAGRGDFGTGAVEHMRVTDVFVALVEYGEAETGMPLFARRGIPRPMLHEFSPNALQRRLPGQLGCQSFCTENGRAFCLYVVLGSRRRASELLAAVHAVLDNIAVEAR